MISQKDIFISAQLLIKQYGDAAEAYASQQMHRLMEKDDVKGAGAWLAIIAAIDDLKNVKSQGNLH